MWAERGCLCGFFPEKERVELDVTGAYSPFQNDAYPGGLCAIFRYTADLVDGPRPARAPRPVAGYFGMGKITDYMQGALAGCREGMMQYHRAAVRDGLAALEPVAGFLAEVLALAEKALARWGHGEERMLEPLWARLERGENPGQWVGRVFGERGVEGLVGVCGVGLERGGELGLAPRQVGKHLSQSV